MRPITKKVSISDIFRNRRGSIPYRLILAIFGIALKIFFRRIETVNADSVPTGSGVIFVMNHPNGLIDPALVFVALPRRISFLAKSTLFRMPVIGWILRTVGALPLYRRIDAGEDVSQNQKTFELCRELLRDGGSIALFPEGVSHNSPKLLPLKSGASRIAIGAASTNSGEPIKVLIIPVGLYYTNKTTFRSEALLHFGEAFEVTPASLDEGGQPPRESVRALTSEIDSALRGVTLNAENEAELHAARIAEEILSSAQREQDLGNEFEFQKEFIKETADHQNVVADRKLNERLHDFDSKLDAFGVEPEHLSLALYRRKSVLREAFHFTWKLILLAPFALIGAVLHFPAYQVCKYSSRWYASGSEDVLSTAKVLAGIIFMPLTWLTGAAITYYFLRSPWALLAIPAGFLLGYAALYTLEEFAEARGWARAIWLFFTKRERFLRLFVERREIQAELRTL
jgi:glycerol-3-phosphate O-acyltransferase / dihydroxyacetone phosphate acyltransferase